MGILDDPTVIAIGVFAGWLVTQSISLFVGKWVIERYKRYARNERAEIEAHFDAELVALEKSLKESIPSAPNLDGIRADVSAIADKVDSFRVDFKDVPESVHRIPETIRMSLLSEKGVEARKFQAALEAAGADVKDSLNLEEAVEQMGAGTNAAIVPTLIKEIADAKFSDAWAGEHPVEALIAKALKIKLVQTLREEGLSAPSVRMTRTNGSGGYL